MMATIGWSWLVSGLHCSGFLSTSTEVSPVDDVPYCGIPFIWRWPHRLGFVFSAVAVVLGVLALTSTDKTNSNMLTWSVVSLGVGMLLLSASSFFYQSVGAAKAR
jgi:hypothetical protein